MSSPEAEAQTFHHREWLGKDGVGCIEVSATRDSGIVSAEAYIVSDRSHSVCIDLSIFEFDDDRETAARLHTLGVLIDTLTDFRDHVREMAMTEIARAQMVAAEEAEQAEVEKEESAEEAAGQ